MHPSLKPEYEQLAILDFFLARYKVGNQVLCVHAHPSPCKPAVSFNTEHKDWVRKTFGEDGWKPYGETAEAKEFEDVRVVIHEPHQILAAKGVDAGC